MLEGERRDLISVLGLVVLLVVRRHPVMRPRVPVIVVVCGLTDFVGVTAGTWTYQPHDVTGLLSLGNPPAAIAGGFCLVYYIGFRLGPVLLRMRSALIPG
ncbi:MULTISPECIES: hypothetical protein [unclassified Streptomyces]|uniref:hypothetical protein n=1 Tax=unclassified Streptomyces TaxID=2593676 RepID=UPI00380129DB